MIIKLSNREVADIIKEYMINRYAMNLEDADYSFDGNGAYTLDTDVKLLPPEYKDED